MKTDTLKYARIFFILSLIFLTSSFMFAATNYVSKTGGHISPFATWGNAATNIQAAVDAAFSGNIVFVNDGTYYPGNQISVTKNITLKSANGAEKTIVDGNNLIRCFLINNYDTLDGFTIKNGFTNNWLTAGGGVFCDHGGTVQNCIITENSVTGDFGYGAGIFCWFGGTVKNCIISNNSACGWYGGYGGGIFCDYAGTIEDCIIIDNSAHGTGGGIFCRDKGSVSNSIIINNTSLNYGGGVYCNNSTVQDCIISYNSLASGWGYGGGIYCENGIIQNCTIKKNWSDWDGGGITCNECLIRNCIIEKNSAYYGGGGINQL